MLDLLRDYLNKITTPEERLVVEHAMQVLEEVGCEDFEYAIEELLNTDDEADAGFTLQKILQLINAHLFQVMQLQGVTLMETANMQMLADLVRGMFDLNNYEGQQEIIDTCNLPAPPREIFAELMTLVTKYSVEETLPYIEEVVDGVLGRLKKNDALPELPQDEEEQRGQRDRLFAYRKYDVQLAPQGGAPVHLTAMLRSGMPLNMPFLGYANLARAVMSQADTKVIARELFGMAIISSDGYDRPVETVKDNLEIFLSDPKTITAVMAEVRQLFTGYQT